MAAEVTSGLRSLLGRLQSFKVDWKFSFIPAENQEYEAGIDREVADLADANVVSSTLKGGHMFTLLDGALTPVDRHAVLLDIDYPAHLVASSTPNHYHLYLDVPGGVDHDKYMALLAMLADCGIIEKGYADVSIARGHSDLRLPWVTKDDQVVHEPGPGINLADADGNPALAPSPPQVNLESDLF